MKKAVLMLEDGSLFEGLVLGSGGERAGEVILNTAVVGYQEMMTDTANAGKILVLTYPLIGNYGVAKKFYDSKKCWISGLVIKENSPIYSNWQAEGSFEDFLEKECVSAVAGIDTRTLAVHLRESGEMFGMIASGDAKKETLLKKLKGYKKNTKRDFIRKISVKNTTKIAGKQSGPNIAVLDLGILNSFLKQLKNAGCSITLLPYDTEPGKILSLRLDGLVISSGPEEDISVPKVVNIIKPLIGKIPILGISLGHEIITLALGGRLEKLNLGHRGVNYPVMAPSSYKGEITVQNHSFVASGDSIKNVRGVKVTLRNLNDDTIEEIESKALKFISTQYYPVSPGFDEINIVFKRFLEMTDRKEKVRACQNAKI